MHKSLSLLSLGLESISSIYARKAHTMLGWIWRASSIMLRIWEKSWSLVASFCVVSSDVGA